jgi:hypothetical protein
MESKNEVKKMADVQTQVVDLLEAVDNLVDWRAFKRIKIRKYSIYPKRVAAVSKSANTIEEFIENLLKDVAGDQLFVTRGKSDKLTKALDSAKENEDEVLRYLKKYPYLSVVLLGSRIFEKSEETNSDQDKEVS